MHTKTKRSRIGALAIVIGSVLSIGAVAGSVSAEEPNESASITKVSKWGGGATSMSSGIRW